MEDNYLISSHNFPQDLATWLENLFPPTQQPANRFVFYFFTRIFSVTSPANELI